MKKLKLFAGPLLLAAFAFLTATNSNAQIPQIVAAGSSGAFTSTVAAMTLPDATQGFSSAICGTNVWTYSDATKDWVSDPRSGSIPNEPGSIAVVWDNSASPNTVCVYMSIDSLVGMRLFHAQSGSGGVAGNGIIHLDPSVSGTPGGTVGLAGQNKVGFVTDTVNNTCGPSSNGPCGLPPAVYNAVNGAHINVGYSDVRPDDALSEYYRVSCEPSNSVSCFGYGPLGGIGTAILSSFNSGDVANPIGWAIAGGTDPFTSLTVPSTKIENVGAYPVMFFYNASDTTAGGLGALLPSNVVSHTISAFLSGNAGFNQDLMGVPTSPLKAVDVVQREPLSGTYTTTDYQAVHERDGDTDYSQEAGFTPTSLGANCYTVPSGAAVNYVSPSAQVAPYLYSGNCSNPMIVPGNGNHRYRSVGSGELIGAVNASPAGANRLGYSFFSLGTFAPAKAGNTRYLSIDGVDPIYSSYSVNNGKFPACTGAFNLGTFSCTAGQSPTFNGVTSGNYRIWNIIRAVRYANCTGGPAPTCYTPPSSGPSVDALVVAAQDLAHSAVAADFVPYQYCTSGGSGSCTAFSSGLNVFRSHLAYPGITSGGASNGNGAEPAENGGDVLGVIFPVVSDITYYNLTGNEFVTWVQ